MEHLDRKKHWDHIYDTKTLSEVSWYQPTPETSLYFIKKAQLSKTARIIDVGGGDSFLVDHLLDLGYSNISVLDISEKAIARAKTRLGSRANQVQWIVCDIVDFKPTVEYDCWHDRAAFHFLTEEKDIEQYSHIVSQNISPRGILILGTFSTNGPTKCSGIPIKQYTESELTQNFSKVFELIEGTTLDHKTPFDTLQNFVFCSFKKYS